MRAPKHFISSYVFFAAFVAGTLGALARADDAPADFPKFSVPGAEQELAALRRLYWLHYPGAGPKATIWDPWLPAPALWPAVDSDGSAEKMRREWIAALDGRRMDAEGYVATHQHASIAHQDGWPFPSWNQGKGGMGWHFSFKDTIGPGWRPNDLNTTDGWRLEGAAAGAIEEDGWRINAAATAVTITTPECKIEPRQGPFIQIRWRAEGMGLKGARLEWTTREAPEWSAERSIEFAPVADGGPMHYTMIPVYRHAGWTGEVARLRVRLARAEGAAGGALILQALFTNYDTRHNINNSAFVQGCARVFAWTRDVEFLKRNIDRMRRSIEYLRKEHGAEKEKIIVTPWVGHEGRSGIRIGEDGKKTILSGEGIGGNYWDLLPFGNKDCYATILYYDALRAMEDVERAVRANPEWKIPAGERAAAPEALARHAAEVKRAGNEIFWNEKTGRFFCAIDADGVGHDYGFTFLNLEAIYYGFATDEHAQAIMEWIDGRRIVEGDTAQGADIYHWRFAPRATTRRNVEYYFWAWSAPESIPWGGQVQDGGAVLGFSHHDLMARLGVLGPENARARLGEIAKWHQEVEAAGGYRKYYDGTREGALQGCGTPGGLGLDCEFFESVMAPQVLIEGFLGLRPEAGALAIDPRLPPDWPELAIDRIRYADATLRVRARANDVEIESVCAGQGEMKIEMRRRLARAVAIDPDGAERAIAIRSGPAAASFNAPKNGRVRVEFAPEPETSTTKTQRHEEEN